MKNFSEIKNDLKRGDIRDIAKVLGKSPKYIKMIIDDDRKAEKLRPKVLELANKILSNRQELGSAK